MTFFVSYSRYSCRLYRTRYDLHINVTMGSVSLYLTLNFQKNILTTFVKMSTTKMVKRASKGSKEIEIFVNEKGANHTLMAKSKFLI